jgi:CubicO group peptidase (beta-lactamase class C family)
MSYDFTPVSNLIQVAVDTIPLQGASLLLMQNDEIIYGKAFGRYTLHTAIPIASGSKWLSASVIMNLVDKGRISLDDSVSKYIPSFTELKGTITIRQLLSHTSGLPGDLPFLSFPDITLAQCVDMISQVELLYNPGTEFYYGGVSFQVAGRVAEVAGGKLWATLFNESIRRPLHMVNTTYGQTQNPRIAGGATSALMDYGNLLLMHLNNGIFDSNRILSSEIVYQMQCNQTDSVPIAFTPQPNDRRYGLGEWRDIVDAEGNAIQLSSQGEYGFSPWIDLQRNILGVFLVDNQLQNVYGLVAQMQHMIRDIIDSTSN